MIETPEPPHLPKLDAAKDKPTHWFEIGLTLVVVLISACSLYVAWHTSHTMEALVAQNARLVKAQSTPILEYAHGNAFEDRTLAGQLRNVGTGPARIAWIRFRIEDKAYVHWSELIQERLPTAAETADFVTTTLTGRMMAAGENLKFFRWKRPEDNPLLASDWDKLDALRWDVSAEACFCSVFEECWTSAMQGDVPKPVQSCEPEPALTTQAAARPPGPPAAGPAH